MPSEDEQQDMKKIMKKLGLILEGELEYILADKARVIYVIGKK